MDLFQHEDHDDHGDDQEGCPMIMTFHAGNCETILFKSVTVRTAGEFVIAVVVIFLISFGFEGLRFWREKLYNDFAAETVASCSSDSTCCDDKRLKMNKKSIRELITHKLHSVQTLLHLVQVTLSYALMLIIMTYNVWLILAVVIGAAVGYFSFGWIRQRSIDVSEHCH